MAIRLNDNLKRYFPKPLDDSYAVWDSGSSRIYANRQEALDLNPYYRYVGLSFVVNDSGTQKEFWFSGGIEDHHLVPKQAEVDLSDYYTKDDTDDLLDQKVDVSYMGNFYTKSDLQLPGMSSVHYSNITNMPDFITGVTSAWDVNTGVLSIQGHDHDLDGRYMLRSNSIVSGYGITASENFQNSVSVQVNTSTLDSRYLRKDVNDNNDTFGLTLGSLQAGASVFTDSVTLQSVGVGVGDEVLLYGPGGLIQRRVLSYEGQFGVANAAGTKQFDVDLGTNLRFAGTGDTVVSFNSSTNTVTINSVPGQGGGGVITSVFGRTTPAILAEEGDYNTSLVTEGSNLYFTQGRVRNTDLTGFSPTNATILATDNVLQAFNKAQGQINTRTPTNRTLNISGTAGNITVSGGTQDLSENRSWTVNLPNVGTAGTYTKVITDSQGRVTDGLGLALSDMPDGVLQMGDNISELVNNVGYITINDIPSPPVTSVNSMTGDITLAPADLGLGNVDNTSDADKPISTATQGALDGKENAFSKGSLVAGTGVTLSGTLANRLVGSGNVTINASNSLTASNGLQIISGVISPQYGTLSGTVAQGNDARINNGQTAYGWGDFRDFGLGTTAIAVSPSTFWESFDRNTSIIRSTSGANSPFSTAGTALHMRWGSQRAQQLFIGITGDLLQFRSSGDADWPYPVRTVWHDGNFTPPVAFTRSVIGLVPSPGGSGTTRYLREDGSWVDPSSGGGGGTATDLSIANRNANTLQIGSSTGTSATVPAATTSLSGLMTAADKTTLSNAITIETDPTVPSHVKAITSGQILNWNTAFGWGDFRDYGFGASSSSLSPSNLWDVITRPTSFLRSTSGANSPFGVVGTGIHMQEVTSRAAQIFVGNNTLKYRYAFDGVWGTVATVWDSNNFTPSDYLLTSNFTWANLSGKPSTFAPSPHSHSAADINSGTLAAARIGNATVSNAKLANMSANTIKGRAGSTGAPQDLTAAQALTVIGAVPTSRTITAGSGLTGGGNLTANRTLTVGAGVGITVNTSDVAITNIAAGSSTSGALRYNGTTRSAGRLYGGTTNPTSTTRLNYDGNLYATNIVSMGQVTGFAASDMRLKDHIKPIENPFDILDKVSGYSFVWDDPRGLNSGKDYGVLAQEVQSVLPELVKDIGGDYLGIKNENGLVAVLIQAVKSLKKELEEVRNGLS